MILSIAIPAYDRPKELLHGLQTFIKQIEGRYDEHVEIVISDDCSPDDSLAPVRELAEKHAFIKFHRYETNVGLERNLIECTSRCTGEYLWIFGDDDYLEYHGALDEILALLRRGQHDFLILNRTRRSFDLSRLISDNWMKLESGRSYAFDGLRAFCLAHGFISVIGFISVNIFRREAFAAVDAWKYAGTMYPQLGAMLEAFHSKPTLLMGTPMVCHRTQTREEKRAALGDKLTEADFMADERVRNAKFFGHPYVSMLAELRRVGAFSPEDVVRIPENTVINGLLIDFLINTMGLVNELLVPVSENQFQSSRGFFAALPLNEEQSARVKEIFNTMHVNVQGGAEKTAPGRSSQSLTISVITPSFNQANFLSACLDSVHTQSYAPMEHLVFDPGSTDGSREIAGDYPGVSLVAEPDAGQSDALNKGFTRSRGDIIAWLNSDDMYASADIFATIVELFSAPDAPDIIYGRGEFVDADGNKLRDAYVNGLPESLPWRLQQECGILQPALFMRRSVVERVGLLRNDRHFCMDYEYWIRCIQAGIRFEYVDLLIARASFHLDNKTYGSRGKSYADVCDMLKEHFGYVNHIWLQRYAEFLAEGYDGVLNNSERSGIADQQKYDEIYRRLLRDYNTSHDAFTLLTKNAAEKGYGDTRRVMEELGVRPAVPCEPIDLDVEYQPGRVLYTVGERRWSYDKNWKTGEIQKAHDFLRRRIRSRSSDTCVVVGNGPSLNKIDFELLRGQEVIVSNNVFLSTELMEHATLYTVVNYLVAEQSGHHINRLDQVDKVLPYWMAYCLNPGDRTHFVDAVGHASFSTDMFKNMSWRHTVTFFNLHLAYGLGYRRVVMIGFDHTYSQPEGVEEQEVIQSYESDTNHFHPDYFRGKKWQAADERMMEEMYLLAKDAFEADGREIINASVGGKLELFRRMTLAEALDRKEVVAGAGRTGNQGAVVVGPFEREEKAHIDETHVVSGLFASGKNGFMIDVGAHEGWALLPFLDEGWTVQAFEPDEINRGRLTERLKNHSGLHRVSIDERCVSDVSRDRVPFYRSDQSTGISGLSAFHDTHFEAQQVGTVSLADYFRDKELPAVDFLKIDTEGHDLFVLHGFPWERCLPKVIECEYEDAKTIPLGYGFHDIADFLAGKGYKVYVSEWHPIVRYGIKHDWCQLRRYPCELRNPKGWGNLLAFRDPVCDKALGDAVSTVLQRVVEVSTLRGGHGKTSGGARAARTFREANALSRSKNFEEALQTYLDLYAAHPLSIYNDNAVRVARQSGFDQISSAKDFIRSKTGRWVPRDRT